MVKNLIKKLNNFKFTSIVMAIVSGVAALYALASIFLYHFAGELEPPKYLVRFVGFADVENGAYLGMILFFAAIISLFISIFVIYSLIPFIKNSEKVTPKKGLLLAGFISGIFEVILIIFMILLIALGHPNTLVLIIVSLPLGLASAVGCLLYLLPYLKCDFYMPEIKR